MFKKVIHLLVNWGGWYMVVFYVPSFVYKALIVSGECYCLGLNI